MKQFDYLFVCAANVGRSQMAQGFYNYYTKGKHCESAALLVDLREKYQHKPHPLIIQVMQEKGIDISSQQISLLSTQLLAQSKELIVLCEQSELAANTFSDFQKPIRFLPIIDPCPQGPSSEEAEQLLETFRRTRDQIEAMVKSLITFPNKSL